MTPTREDVERVAQVLTNTACTQADPQRYGPNAIDGIAPCITAPMETIKHWCGPCQDMKAALMLRDLLARAETDTCDACGGTGTPASGPPCMCGGTGRMSDAARYLRRELTALRARLTALADAMDEQASDGSMSSDEAAIAHDSAVLIRAELEKP